ncbi:MAG: integrase family protein [Myxococcales bacterium]|nr:integrase family protein [Myxococcales bacterium]
MRLNNRAIKAAISTGQRTELYDEAVVGLHVVVTKAGAATFAVRYRCHGRHRRMRLGRFGQVTIDEARKRAREILADAARGVDPQGLRERARDRMLLVDAFERLLMEPGRRGRERKPRTVALYRQLWRDHIAKALGRRRVDSITRSDVEALKVATARRIGDGRGHGQPAAAATNRTLALLSAILGAAERWGEIPAGGNPCRGVARYHEERRERCLRPEERAAVEQALGEAEALPLGSPGSISPAAALALRLLLWTGARTSEITGLRWGMVDLDRRCLNLPDSKVGAVALPSRPSTFGVEIGHVSHIGRDDPELGFGVPYERGDRVEKAHRCTSRLAAWPAEPQPGEETRPRAAVVEPLTLALAPLRDLLGDAQADLAAEMALVLGAP